MAFTRALSSTLLALAVVISLTAAKTPEPERTAGAGKPVRECAEVGVMAKRLMKDRNLAYLSDAIDSDDLVHMWYVNSKTGRWVELEVTDDLQACIARQGYDWHFATAR